MSIKLLPNFITGIRFALTAILLFLPVPGTEFFTLYLASGATDMLDGWLARRLHAESPLGARIDSAADVFFVFVALIRLWPIIRPGIVVLLWVSGIALLRIAAAGIAQIRFGKFDFLHTWANKFTGLVLFLYPLSLALTRSDIVQHLLCLLATISAIEELFIEFTAKQWDANRKGIWETD